MNAMQHPDTQDLDRLRAGLLDDAPAEKAALKAHLDVCPSCRATAERLRETLSRTAAVQDDPWFEQALRARRAQALKGQSSGARTGFGKAYIWGPAIAAALVLAVVGVNFQALFAPPGGDSSAPQVAGGATSVSPAPDNHIAENQTPDVYDDIDFYIWLSSQHETANQGNRS